MSWDYNACGTLTRTFWIQCDKGFPVNKLQDICVPSCLPSSSLVHLFSVLTLGSSLLDSHVLGKGGGAVETHSMDKERAEEVKLLPLDWNGKP